MQNSNANKKQSFLGGAAVLALATAVVKLIGAFYKIPIQHVIGNDGYSYFNTAYAIYNVLLMIATTGLPVAMSRMIAEATTQQDPLQIRRVYDAAKRLFLSVGLAGSLFMALLCVPLADFMGQRNAWFPILCLSPAVLLLCLSSVNRGFFQGQGDMRPTSISQVLEALCKLLIGLGLAMVVMYFFRRNGLETTLPDGRPFPKGSEAAAALSRAHAFAAGGAIIGVTLGCGLAAFYLYRLVRKTETYSLVAAAEEAQAGESTTRKLLKIAVPITLGAAGLQLITLVDTAVYMMRLKNAAGFSQEAADDLKGIYDYCQTIFNMPAAFITSIVVAVIPALTEQITMKNRKGERVIADSAFRVMALVASPCAVGLAVLSRPIYALLAKHTPESLNVATPLLAVLGICAFFNAVVLVSNSIMQSHGDVVVPVTNMLIGGIIKIIVSFVLVGNPEINILGAAIGTVICYASISILNLVSMAKRKYPVSLTRTVLKPVIASLIMGAGAALARRLLEGMGLSNAPVTLGSIAVGGVLYVILVLALRVITREDCTLLPKGDKIAKLLHIS